MYSVALTLSLSARLLLKRVRAYRHVLPTPGTAGLKYARLLLPPPRSCLPICAPEIDYSSSFETALLPFGWSRRTLSCCCCEERRSSPRIASSKRMEVRTAFKTWRDID